MGPGCLVTCGWTGILRNVTVRCDPPMVSTIFLFLNFLIHLKVVPKWRRIFLFFSLCKPNWHDCTTESSAHILTVVLFQELFGTVQVTTLSSVCALGSSNWIIQSCYEKVSYVSGSSLLTAHPQVILNSPVNNSGF